MASHYSSITRLQQTATINSCLALLLSLFLLSGCQSTRENPLAQEGILDLSSWDFRTDGSVKLNGQWMFYWQQFINPAESQQLSPPAPTGLIDIPGSWNNFKVDEGPVGPNGYGTARLKVILPEECVSTPMAIHILNQSTAYSLWINGELLAGNGSVGIDKKSTVPQFLEQQRTFTVESRVIDVTIQVANFHHRKGGVWNPIRLGFAQTILDRDKYQWMFDSFLFGALFIIGMYQASIFLLHRRDRSSLYFSLFTLTMALRVLVSGNYYLTVLFPFLGWETVYTIELLSVFVAGPTLLLFIATLYSSQANRRIVNAIVGLFGLLILAAIITPGSVSSYLVPVNQILLLLSISYVLFILFRAMAARERGSGIILAAMVVMGGTVIADILSANRLIYTIQLAPFGVLFLIGSQSFVLASRFSEAFHGVKKLSLELEEKNISLQRLDQLKDEFLANTSHELRTPLNGIIGLAEAIGDGAHGEVPSSARRSISLIVSSGRRLLQLLNDILDISRLKSQDVSLQKVPVDLRSLSETVLSVLQPLAEEKELQLENRIPANLPYLHGDELRLQQILFNLVGNAIKFTHHGKVTINAVQNGESAEISVIDTGIGIPRDHFAAVFNPFEQVEGKASRQYGGTGLGLAITRSLVELHQGTISVKSQPGEGSCFSFTIPVSHEIQRTPSNTNDQIRERNYYEVTAGEGTEEGEEKTFERSILVVDDDPVNLEVVKSQLSTLNEFEIRTAASGNEALEKILAKPPCLLLLDIMMPGINGYEVCIEIRKDFPPQVLPIIFLTAKNQISDLTYGFSCGATDYLAKPFIKDELIARVKAQLSLRDAYMALQENMRLKAEIEKRVATEVDLQRTQNMLSLILDTIDEAIIGINESLEITFCNQGCQKLLDYTVQEFLGQPLSSLFANSSGNVISQAIEQFQHDPDGGLPKKYTDVALAKYRGEATVTCHLELTTLEFEDEIVFLFIIQTADQNQTKTSPLDQRPSLMLIEDLNTKRRRLKSLEETLSGSTVSREHPEILQEISQIDRLLHSVENVIDGETNALQKNRLGVEVMNLSVKLWEASTNSTKADFARESGIWKVYMNRNGHERTQTLDKYLDLTRFPKTPRWNNVYQTATFVLARCETPTELREELDEKFHKLKLL